MKRTLTIGITGIALAATLSVVTVRARSPEPVTAADVLPAYEIVARAIDAGLDPIGQPVRRGAYYVLHAYDPRRGEVRVVADAQLGDILSVGPVRAANAYAPRYDRGPRIIHVPQPGEEDVASVPRARQVMPDDDDEEVVPPPPRRQSAPRLPKQKNSDAPPAPRRKPYSVTMPERPAPAERRTVLSAPQHDGPTPVRPTPRFAKETGEKFPPPPPPGYTPPSNVPPEPVPAETAPQDNASSGD